MRVRVWYGLFLRWKWGERCAVRCGILMGFSMSMGFVLLLQVIH